MFYPLFILFIALFSFCVNIQDEVEYLENLIDAETRKSRNFKPRLNNEDLLGCAGETNATQDFGKFDFIIVGSGTSGSIIANRLTEVENWKILLLEAGDLNDEYTDIPYVFESAALSDRDWGYMTVPQKQGCFGRKNNQFPYTRGKILGGSSTMNALVYARGIKEDYDTWAREGNKGWSWDEVFEYFKKLENYREENIDLRFRGSTGPINISYVQPLHILHKFFVRAHKEMGIPYVEDFNAEKVSGVSRIQQLIQNGRRVSGANNYIRPVWKRKNFNISLKSFVTRILIENTTKTAYGVEFVKDGKKFHALARKEVILSAGAINSPQLLMLSGIGPKQHLEKHGIGVIKDSPVGKYMKDHIGFRGVYFMSNFTEPQIPMRDHIKLYLSGLGPFTSPSNYRSISYYNVRNESSPQPNMEIDFVPPRPIGSDLPRFFNYKQELLNVFNRVNLSTHWTFHLYFLHPKSSGTLRLKSANPKDFPLIDPKIFDNVEDIEDMYKGIEVALKFAETSVGKLFNLSLALNVPACSDKTYRSKAFWYCALRQLAYPAYHASSTAKMGPHNDPLAVVDHELKVYGINGLRVIDASIVPSTVTGHMNAPALLIGEKGADLIKKAHQIL